MDQLGLFDLLSLDLMKPIELAKKSWINVVVAKITMKEEAASLNRYTCPKFECRRITKKINMLLFKESKPVSFSNWHFVWYLLLPPSLHFLISQLLESFKYKTSDRWAINAIKATDGLKSFKRRNIGIFNPAVPPYFYHCVNLLRCDIFNFLFHIYNI